MCACVSIHVTIEPETIVSGLIVIFFSLIKSSRKKIPIKVLIYDDDNDCCDYDFDNNDIQSITLSREK